MRGAQFGADLKFILLDYAKPSRATAKIDSVVRSDERKCLANFPAREKLFAEHIRSSRGTTSLAIAISLLRDAFNILRHCAGNDLITIRLCLIRSIRRRGLHDGRHIGN